MTDAMEATMVEQDWQARSQRRKRRINQVIGALFCVGLASGFLVGLFEDENADLMTGDSIPAWLAVVTAIAFVIAVPLGSWKLMQASDELERAIHNKTTIVAGNVMLIGYPTWLILWKGGLATEPDAMWLFLASFVSSGLAYVWYKFR
jgi:hypothetical protein